MDTVIFGLYPVAGAFYDLKVPKPQDENDENNHDHQGHGAKPPGINFAHYGIET